MSPLRTSLLLLTLSALLVAAPQARAQQRPRIERAPVTLPTGHQLTREVARQRAQPLDLRRAWQLELRKTAWRMASLDRLSALATAREDAPTLARIIALRKREQARHQRAKARLVALVAL